MNCKRGQSIVELIVAMAIGVIVIVAAVSAISPTLKISSDVIKTQTASALGKELLEHVRIAAEANWHNIDNLLEGPANRYYIVATSSPFTVASGIESVTVATTTYTRYFYVDAIYRNSNGQIDSSGSNLDLSSRKVTVVYSWLANASNTIVSYLTRGRDEVFSMTDWTGGPNQTGPVTVTSTGMRFATSSNIDYMIDSGSIVLTGFH